MKIAREEYYPWGVFIRDIRRFLYTSTMEQKLNERLFKRVEDEPQNGDTAKQEIASSNMLFVAKQSLSSPYNSAGKYVDYHLAMDLIQEGYFALLKAAEKYDHQAGTTFLSYAVNWARHSVQLWLNSKNRIFKISWKLQKAISLLEEGKNPGEIAKRLGVSEKWIIFRMMSVAQASLQMWVPGEEDDGPYSTLEEIIGDWRYEPSEIALRNSLLKEINKS